MPLNNDESVKRRLEDFRPLDVKPLNAEQRRQPWAMAGLIAAGLLLLTLVLVTHPSPSSHRTSLAREHARPPMTLMELNAAVRRNELDLALSRNAAATLPRTDRPNTALGALAKD